MGIYRRNAEEGGMMWEYVEEMLRKVWNDVGIDRRNAEEGGIMCSIYRRNAEEDGECCGNIQKEC